MPFRRLLNELLIQTLPFDWYKRLHAWTGFRTLRRKFRNIHGYELNLKNPKTFNEKIVYRKLFDRDPRYPVIADKVRARLYVREKLGKAGESILIPPLQTADRAEDLDFDRLPESFIIKPNFSSGTNFIVRDKNKVCVETLKKRIASFMRKKYRYPDLVWHVQEIPRKILVETLLLDAQGNIPRDYKFFVFHGKVKLIQADLNRFGKHERAVFDAEWNAVDVKFAYDRPALYPGKPAELRRMRSIAETLAEDFDFLRVDLYFYEGRVYFGELTITPEGGSGKITPAGCDAEWGSYWDMHENPRSLSSYRDRLPAVFKNPRKVKEG